MTKVVLPTSPPSRGNWVQTERAAHEAWAALMRSSPRAAELMHHLVARVGEHNAVVISQDDLARMMGKSKRTVIRAAQDLADANWIEVRQVGKSGGVNAYVINDRIAWSGKRDGIRYSLFSASVVVSDQNQPDAEALGMQKPLRQLPKIGEGQLPTGEGLPPPSEPALPGMEPDLPQPEALPEIALGKNEELLTGKDGKLYIRKTHDSRNYNPDGTYEVLGKFTQTIELTPQEMANRLSNPLHSED